jgi:redox-sensitive bicupin YhaK (pirin superfamily)
MPQFHVAAGITARHGRQKNKALGREETRHEGHSMKTTTLNRATTTDPTLVKRPAAARGQTETGWLHSRHTFSFGGYFDADHMGFRSLRVINDDVVEPGEGFGEHPHRDAEIFSYVIEGELEHKDSLGNGRVIKAGDLQYISAGRGVLHSEFNPSPKNPVHFLQIWLRPKMGGGEPRYAEKSLGQSAGANSLTLLFSGEPRDGAVGIRADADIHFGRLDAGKRLEHRSSPGRAQWLHVIAGDVSVLGEALQAGDGAAIENASALEIQSREGAQFLLFDLK